MSGDIGAVLFDAFAGRCVIGSAARSLGRRRHPLWSQTAHRPPPRLPRRSPLKLGGTLGLSFASYATILYFRVRICSLTQSPPAHTVYIPTPFVTARARNPLFSLSQLQYILAAHLGNNIPPKARVVQYGIGDGKTAYYYPPDTVGIYGVDPRADSGLLLQARVAPPFPAHTSPPIRHSHCCRNALCRPTQHPLRRSLRRSSPRPRRLAARRARR